MAQALAWAIPILRHFLLVHMPTLTNDRYINKNMMYESCYTKIQSFTLHFQTGKLFSKGCDVTAGKYLFEYFILLIINKYIIINVQEKRRNRLPLQNCVGRRLRCRQIQHHFQVHQKLVQFGIEDHYRRRICYKDIDDWWKDDKGPDLGHRRPGTISLDGKRVL